MTEVRSEEAPIRACRTINISGSYVVVVGQDNGAVRWVIHPPPDGGLGGIIYTGPRIDDLPPPETIVPCAHFPGPIAGPVRASMGEEIIDRHVQAVDTGGNLE